MGIWIGLTLWTVPLVGAMALVIGYRTLTSSGWAVMLAALTVLIFPVLPLGTLEQHLIWVLNGAILAYKHRAELTERPRLRARSGETVRSER
jgi:glycerol-3-phosphate acyltransferase PlsY